MTGARVGLLLDQCLTIFQQNGLERHGFQLVKYRLLPDINYSVAWGSMSRTPNFLALENEHLAVVICPHRVGRLVC
jgi:hypothetical protein